MEGLLDLDIIVYMIGSACDGRHYMYKGEKWEGKKLLDKQLVVDGIDPKTYKIEVQKDPETWSKCKKSLITHVEDIMDRSECVSFRGFLSGRSNFRYDLATILPYKGNRSGIEKPTHYDAIRQFLVDVYEADVSINMEADDAVGLAHTPGETLICTTDKDLDCIPGDHFNWVKGERYGISYAQATRNFYKQILTGDPTDNIPGLYNVGAKSVLLKKVQAMGEEQEMYDYVFSEYTKRFGSYAEKFMTENAKLLWILQNRKNIFMV